MKKQTQLNISEPVETIETYEFEPIQGYPMLNWKGKRPFRSTQYYPAQLKETYGEEVDGWQNKIYWGDNLQVMSHLLKTYRGKINLIYIDPPFDSKADYKKRIELKSKKVENDRTAFEEKQYTDIWTNDEYLQFMYERLILMRELLADNGSIYVHCDWRVNAYMRLILDEVFGKSNFQREIVWDITVLSGYKSVAQNWIRGHESLVYYSKNSTNFIFNKQYTEHDEKYLSRFNKVDEDGRRYFDGRGKKRYLDEVIEKGKPIGDVWSDIMSFQQIPTAKEKMGYPTQKPEALLERIIKVSSDPGDLVFDCFMGSGTTQAVAMKLGRRFIGADINLGAVEITTQRLTNLAKEIQKDVGNTYQIKSGGGGQPLSIPALKSTTSTTTTCSEILLRRNVSSLKLWRFRSYLLVAFMTVRRMAAWSRSCRSIASPPAPT